MRKSFLLVAMAFAFGSQRPSAAPPTPVVVELFTSEGCESCPPADVLLQQLASTQPVTGAQIVPLSLHVDYWDQLGWKDRFSSAALTNRQRVYGARFNTESVYTPQMVVDGRSELVGSDGAAARKAIARAAALAHGSVRIALDGAQIIVTASDLPPHGDRADIVVAVTEDHLKSNVTRGENHGRTLTHTAVVHRLITIGEAAGRSADARTTIAIDPAWKRDDIRIVAFVQERRGGAVLASATIPFEPGNVSRPPSRDPLRRPSP
jgi:hypothetical protein